MRGLAVAGLAVAAIACGGSADDASEQADVAVGESATEESTAVGAAVGLLNGRWGEEGAFFVVVRALDQGYGAEQIVVGADRVAADGTITSVAPEGEPLGMLTELPAGQSMAPRARPFAASPAGDDDPANAAVGAVDETLAEIFTAGQEAVARMQERETADDLLELGVSLAVLKLGMQGYSAPQIIEAIILGEVDVADGEGNCSIAIRSNDGWLEPTLPAAGQLGCDPVWVGSPDASPGNSEVAQSVPPQDEDAETVGGSFSGPIDFVGYFELVSPGIPGIVTETNEMDVVIDGDEVTSINGTGSVYWPETVTEDGGICESDTTWSITAVTPVEFDADDGFSAPGSIAVVGTSTCSGWGDGEPETVDENDPVTIVGTPTNGGSRLVITYEFEGTPLGLTATLTRS